MEDVTGWYSSAIRQGVYEDDGKFNPMSGRFREWLTNRLGRVVLQKEPQKEPQNKKEGIEAHGVVFVHYPKTLVYFEKQEDLVDYLLSFDEIPPWRGEIDAAAFYVPYIPLTVTSATNSSYCQSVTFNTRYHTDPGLLGSVNCPGNGNSSVYALLKQYLVVEIVGSISNTYHGSQILHEIKIFCL